MSIKTKLLLLVTCALVFSGTINAVIIYTQNNSRLATHIDADVKSSLDYNTQVVNAYFLRAQKNLANLSRDPQIIKALETKDEQELGKVQEKFTLIREALDIMDNVALQEIDGSRCVVIATDDQAVQNVGKDFSDRDYCSGILNTRAPYISSAYMSATNNRPVVGFVVPVKNDKDEMIGFVYGAINITELQGYLGGLQEDSVVDVLDRSGSLFLTTRKDVQLFNLGTDPEESELPEVREAIGNGAQEGYFTDGNDFVGYKNIGFVTIVFEESAKSLFAFATTLNWVILISTTVAIVLTALIIAVFIGRITIRIKRLSEITERMVQGDFKVKLTSKELAEKDELGVLARTFSEMFRKLEETYNSLEEKVRKRTADLEKSEADLMKVLTDSERLNNLMIGRELKMIELKKEVTESKIASDLKVAELEKKLIELREGKA